MNKYSSSSKSPSHQRKTCEVFLSFRGKDTRISFVSHLSKALSNKQIAAFIDDLLEAGVKIEPAILKKIEQSRIALVIFSQNYADSSWCLDELAKIADCKKASGQTVLPVFLDVDPTHVQELSGSFGDAFAKLKKEMISGEDKLITWERAIKDISYIKGWDSRTIQNHATLIEKIVEDISEKLSQIDSDDFDKNNDGLVGIHRRIVEIKSLIFPNDKPNDVIFLGIWGMAGSGKTTIATTLFNKLATKFEGKYFVPNVGEESGKQSNSLTHLRDKMVSKLLGEEKLDIGTTDVLPSFARNRLQKKKVLIVLDDVTTSQQVEFLVGKQKLYGPGSRVIITSRDKKVLEKVCNNIYELEILSDEEALKLLWFHALTQDPTKEHLELAQFVLQYAKGNPFALKVLGSNLRGKSIEEWGSELEKLESTPNLETHNILRISYDTLKENEKKIFLDIACCFTGWGKDVVQRILDGCGFFATRGIQSLIDKCLVTISSQNELEMQDLFEMQDPMQQLGRNIVRQEDNQSRFWANDDLLEMQDLMQQFGRYIVRQEAKKIENQSRFWNNDDIFQLLNNEMGTTEVESICLDLSQVRNMRLSPKAFLGMENLRLLRLHNSYTEINKVQLPYGLEYLSGELRLLEWDRYPLPSLPSDFFPGNLVHLVLRYSKVIRLCYGQSKILNNLKCIDLSYSINLIAIPEFFEFPNLEELYLGGCINLREIPSSIEDSWKLVAVVLTDCKRLTILPSFFYLTTLKLLSLNGCSNITDFPKVLPSIETLDLRGTGIEFLPRKIETLCQLQVLDLGFCKSLEDLTDNMNGLDSLQVLSLKECSELQIVPDSICDLQDLEVLDLEGCMNLTSLPDDIGDITSLTTLSIERTAIKRLPNSIKNLSNLEVLNCGRCHGLRVPPLTDLFSLEELYLDDCGLLRSPRGLHDLRWLKVLNLAGNDFDIIPVSFRPFCDLEMLILRECYRLECLPNLPDGLLYLDASDCESLERMSSYSITYYVRHSNFGNCFNLEVEFIEKVTEIMMEFGEEPPQLDQFPQESNTNGSNAQRMSSELTDRRIFSKKRGQWDSSCCCFPGKRVPQEFNYIEDAGSSIVIPSMDVTDNESFGMVFCAVVECQNDYDSHRFDIECDCQFITEPGSQFDLQTYFHGYQSPIIEVDKSIFLNRKHVFIWRDQGIFYQADESYFTEAAFQFYAIDVNGNRIRRRCKVISCAVDLLSDMESRIGDVDSS